MFWLLLLAAAPGEEFVVSSGMYTSCAIDRAGALYCWGSSPFDDRAMRTAERLETPEPVLGVTENSGQLCAWGASGGGCTGSRIFLPTKDWSDGWEWPDARRIAMGDQHHCWVGSGVWCEGSNNDGELGRTPIPRQAAAEDLEVVPGLPEDVLSIDIGRYHTCTLTESAEVWCWGPNTYGEVSQPPSPVAPPTKVLEDVVHVATGGFHSCAVRRSGDVQCWGRDHSSQLGPFAVSLGSPGLKIRGGIAMTSLGDHFSCLLSRKGQVYCWGDRSYGAVGHDDPTVNARTPHPVAVPGKVYALSAGPIQACAASSEGVFCWGRNYKGKLGDGTEEDSAVPRRVLGLP